jgi:uncharacterized protein YacL
MKMNSEEKKLYLQQLYSTREKYIENKYDQCKQFDQNMFLVSSAIFGISFAFMSNVINKPLPYTKWIIASSWTLILINIVLSLTAYLISYKAYKEYINIIDIKIRNIDNVENQRDEEPKNRAARIAEVLNNINLILFTLGLLSLVVYLCINIFGGTYAIPQ